VRAGNRWRQESDGHSLASGALRIVVANYVRNEESAQALKNEALADNLAITYCAPI
jgi:hypothetical protein